MDYAVLRTQQWLNATYGNVDGFERVEENGKTGWSTVYALTRALQHELGITNLSDNFGPETTSRFQPLVPGDYQYESNMIYILQGALWCKGIPPGSWTGIFDDATVQSVKNFQAYAGLPNQNGIVTTPMMKALLNMSAFVLVSGGDPKIRQIQQYLNRDYSNYIGELQPCDGIYGRETNKALIYALQKEEGLSADTANGTFGPTTTRLCPTLSVGDSRTNFVRILQYSLYCNGTQFDPGAFDGVYGSNVKSVVSLFQSFMALPVTGIANMSTIKGLLSSAGDTSRDALACDTATILTTSTAQAIKRAEFEYVGRYLTGHVRRSDGAIVSKAMTREELQTIFSVGLKVFPIYEDGGYTLDYFHSNQGSHDARTAIDAATRLGIPSQTTIFFAVDFDALDEDITNNILPYFHRLKDAFESYSDVTNAKYKIGVYGPRNVCSRVCDAGYAEKSFVADMSTGWSGNLGFRMPNNWAYDQFNTITVGNSTLGYVEVDMDGFSGRDIGFDHIINNIPSEEEVNTARLNALNDLKQYINVLKGFPTSNIIWGHEYTVSTGPIEVTLTAESDFTDHSSDYISINIKNGQPSVSIGDALGIFSYTLPPEEINSYHTNYNNIAASINYGNMLIKFDTTDYSFTMEYVFQKEFAVNDFVTAKLQVSVKYKINYNDPYTPPEDVPVPDIRTVIPPLGITVVVICAGIGFVYYVTSSFARQTLDKIGQLLKDIIGAVTH